MKPPASKLASPHEAIAAMLERLTVVGTERVALARSAGRVLAEPVTTDRPSPPCDVSAMDGYAVRLADLQQGRLSVSGTIAAGHAPLGMQPGAAVRIFTGAPVPREAEAVIKREDVQEEGGFIVVPPQLKVSAGTSIRRQGENAPAGLTVVEAGMALNAATVGGVASCGVTHPLVYRRVRVAVLVTGDELLRDATAPQPWQIRDSNGPTLAAMLGVLPWVDLVAVHHVPDALPETVQTIVQLWPEVDVLLLSGGVSAGDYDHVPAALTQAGGEIIFHKVAQRPGKPMLGAIGPQGQAVLGLPGNPVSVLVAARRWGSEILRRRAGFNSPQPLPYVQLTQDNDATLGLWWYRSVKLTNDGGAQLVSTAGSGDNISAAQADGFIETPPHQSGVGPWPFYSWSL